MDKRARSGIAAGSLLILLGIWLVVAQFVPALQGRFEWPLTIVIVGVFLFILGLLIGVPALAVPACIVGGIGGILYWQNATGNWESWSYAWTLIPGFVGVGIILAGLLEGNARQALREGGDILAVSLVMFLIVGAFFGVVGIGPLGRYWPVLVIALGLFGLLRALFSRRSPRSRD